MDENVHIGKVIAVAALIVSGVVFAGLVSWMVATREGGLSGAIQPVSAPRILPPLDSAPQTKLEAYRREKRDRLESYGWVDRKTGRVRIPIERAMRLMVERQ